MSTEPFVILDIGRTLVNGPARGPAARIAATLGLSGTQKRALRRALMTRPFTSPSDVAEFARRELSLPNAERAIADLWTAQEHETKPVPGALDALMALRGQGARLALISNIWQPYLTSVRRHFGAFFDEHIPPALQLFSFQVGHAKPEREIFERALSAAGIHAAAAVMVGDSYDEDIAPAAALGMATVWVDPDGSGTVRSVAEVDFDMVSGGARTPG
jgi:HAD superfamily hydrolase (TIGR01509 family)